MPAKIIMTLKGRRNISWKATIRRMFLDWNSTKFFMDWAPHMVVFPVEKLIRLYDKKRFPKFQTELIN